MVLKYHGRRVRTAVLAVAAALGSLGLAGCGTNTSTPGVLEVVGAQAQYGDLLAQLGGAYVHVTSLVSNPNTDPHNFEASPRVARTIAAARLIVQNGDGYDPFMNQLEAASSNASRTVVTVATLLHRTTAPNPHFWYAPTTMPLLARTITRDLEHLDPAHAAYFRARAAAFHGSWAAVTRAVAAAQRWSGRRRVATTEPVGDYLLAALGVANLTPFRFQANVMNGVDPSPQDIVTQQALLAQHRVDALCFNAQVSSPVTSGLVALAQHDHVALVALYEIMPRGLHVQQWLLAEIHALEVALEHGVSTVRLS